MVGLALHTPVGSCSDLGDEWCAAAFQERGVAGCLEGEDWGEGSQSV